MKLIKEFKEFAIKGNVVDLATAVIIGGAFGKIVSSLVADIIMPLIGVITGGNDFTGWKIAMRPEIKDATGVVTKAALNLNAGIFIQNIVDFLIISASVFLMVKVLLNIKNKFKKEEEFKEKAEEIKEPGVEEKLLTEIRDILKNKA